MTFTKREIKKLLGSIQNQLEESFPTADEARKRTTETQITTIWEKIRESTKHGRGYINLYLTPTQETYDYVISLGYKIESVTDSAGLLDHYRISW